MHACMHIIYHICLHKYYCTPFNYYKKTIDDTMFETMQRKLDFLPKSCRFYYKILFIISYGVLILI